MREPPCIQGERTRTGVFSKAGAILRSAATAAVIFTAASMAYASLPPFGPAQPHSGPPSQGDFGISKGKLIVAKRHINDDTFGSTVILLVHYEKDGTMGLVINRPAQRNAKKDGAAPEGKGHGPVFSGGPVEKNTHWVLIRSKGPIEGCTPVLEEVCMAQSSGVLDNLVKSQSTPPEFRVYIGYAGWRPGQLEREISRGGWHLTEADAERVFSERPEGLWDALVPK